MNPTIDFPFPEKAPDALLSPQKPVLLHSTSPNVPAYWLRANVQPPVSAYRQHNESIPFQSHADCCGLVQGHNQAIHHVMYMMRPANRTICKIITDSFFYT